MANTLFIKANDRSSEQAISVQMYEAFLKNYKESNPGEQVTEVDLYKEELPYYGNDAINGLYKKSNGFDLTEKEAQLVKVIEAYQEQFMAADKIVFAFPLWNFTVPAPLITYISYLSQAGKTFRYTPEGIIGLVPDKKVALLSASGGVFSEGPMASMEMAVKYIKTAISLWGITNPVQVVIEGHNQYPDRAKEIIADGLNKTAELAAKF
ncbi:FMN-dependent NADH-azoreductase [Brevibacillus daliensis]|uniref:FMN-dependent NADH-azoreductase n=1 Tax=Brevibacillus daliensis TaxID=2892995 RepID=UPI001E571607|nr:FMN-dependent NADH-azoreductase [Brevibacillus daliensis]